MGVRFAIGHRFGRYEVLAELGSGGMREIYRAVDPQLRRDVAIKVIARDEIGSDLQARLES